MEPNVTKRNVNSVGMNSLPEEQLQFESETENTFLCMRNFTSRDVNEQVIWAWETQVHKTTNTY